MATSENCVKKGVRKYVYVIQHCKGGGVNDLCDDAYTDLKGASDVAEELNDTPDLEGIYSVFKLPLVEGWV